MDFHVLWQRKYVIDTFPEAEIIAGTIDPDKEAAAALPHGVIADLECLDPISNLLVRLRVTILSNSSNTKCSYCKRINKARH